MTKFTVTLQETVFYTVEVEAENEEAAEAAAEAAFVQGNYEEVGIAERCVSSVYEAESA